jgi:D-alanyl-lipoteichoic acid acyltransferase DltB (MBOAT superfamily)
MSFLNPAFFLSFLPLSLLIFYLVGAWGGRGGATLVYGLISILFCVPFGWRFLSLTLASAAVNWMVCSALLAEGGSDAARRWLLRIGVLFDLLVLVLFKYLPAMTGIGGTHALAPALLLWVPITISFYTFQRLVLLVDCYNRDPAAHRMIVGEGGWQRFLAFTMSFPNLVIGPIAFASEVGKQMGSKQFGRVRITDFQVGVTLFVIGLFKKLVIADALGADIVGPVFKRIGSGQPGHGIDAAFAIFAYSAQLYFDFSGYSDMALGVARLFGLRLPYNFNSPLRATGIVDFYRRWHITLTRVVARFLFQNLALRGTRFARRRKWKGIRRKLCELWLPLIANFLVIGVWHGAAWTFVVFGLVHGVWYIIETQLRSRKDYARWAAKTPEWQRVKLGQAITLVPLALTFSLFRSASLAEFGHLVRSAVEPHDFLTGPATHVVAGGKLLELAAAFAIIWLLPNAIELLSRYRPGIATFVVPSHTPRALAFRWQPTLVWGLFVAVLIIWVIKVCGVPAPFVYGGF